MSTPRLYDKFNATTAEYVASVIWHPVAEVIAYNRLGLGVEVRLDDGQIRVVDHRRFVIANERPVSLRPGRFPTLTTGRRS